MKTVYIGIGSNMGDPLKNCNDSVKRIVELENCKIISVSSFYLTEPFGMTEQDWYINGAVSLETGLSAFDLINKLSEMEASMGRVRKIKWGPRVIDLDILLFGHDIIDSERLMVPHPLMHLRRFVLAPMAELAPDLIHPVIGKSMTELLRSIPEDNQIIKRLEGI
jgi:2-amino-4-hydroxy-6-hydroxymethyldihydropteridine diphosphokinase